MDHRTLLTRTPLVLSTALGISACSALVDVSRYSFDVDPCPRPAACPASGRELAFVVRATDLPRADARGRRDGFDLDGTDAIVCRQRDFTAPDDTPGIDNQLAVVLELYEGLTEQSFRSQSEALTRNGEGLELVVLSNVDDLVSDDCIQVARRPAVLPPGLTPDDLDRDGDGLLDPGLELDYLPTRGHDRAACVIDGVVHARFPPQVDTIAGTDIEATISSGRLRMPLGGEAPITALLGGSLPIADLGGLPEAVLEFLRPRADLEPSPDDPTTCGALSFGVELELVPAVLGARRTP